MDRNGRTLIQFALQAQAVITLKIQLDTLVDVPETDPGSASSGLGLLLEQILQHILRHAHAVIGYLDIDIAVLFIPFDADPGILIHGAVVDRVLQKRLNDQLDRTTGFDLGRDIDRRGEFALVTHLLNVQIVLRMDDLIPDRDDVITAALTDTEQCC